MDKTALRKEGEEREGKEEKKEYKNWVARLKVKNVGGECEEK